MARFLQIGNYPPPVCGWAIQTKLLTAELRQRGHTCQVLNINENRKKKSPEYVDVQSGFDYLYKLFRFALSSYQFHVHVNGESKKGYLLALAAALVGRLVGRPAFLTFHGGLPQTYFPRLESRPLRWAFQLLFHLGGNLSCDSLEIKQAIEHYGVDQQRVAAIPCFSSELLDFRPVDLGPEPESFLAGHRPVFFCYVSFRPEYQLPILREAMNRFRQQFPAAGFIWLGFPAKELPAAREYTQSWSADEAESLLLLGNLTHDEFLTLLSRCFAYIRTPACDGVSASVLESLALGVPVVASENSRRPPGVVSYPADDPAALCVRLVYLVEHYDEMKGQTRLGSAENNTRRTADWLLERSRRRSAKELAHAG